MRRRKRPDWPVTVYKYWAEPLGELPEAVWSQARAMQDAWNTMVGMHEEATREAAASGEEEAGKVWAQFRSDLINYIRTPEVCDRLNWAAREFVLDRFREAARSAARLQRLLRKRHRLERVIIPHRFTGGGVPPERLFTSRPVRVSLRPVEPDAYHDARRRTVRRRITRGELRVGEEPLIFSTILHRPVPENAIVKGFAWCGRRHPTRGWQWSINITVEDPPTPRVRSRDGFVRSISAGA